MSAQATTKDPFRDRVAVVTGAASGIGFGMARAFASRGARIVLADIDEPSLRAAEKRLGAEGAQVLGVPTDVTRRESVEALADAAFSHFGAAHLVCNNAGIAVMGSLVDASPADWKATMDLNFWGVVHGVDTFVPRLIEQKQGGHLLNTASMAGLIGMQYLGIYCVSKFAVVALSESLERELHGHDIGVSVLCPMIVATNIAANTARVLGRETPSQASGSVTGSDGPPPADRLRGGVISVEAVAMRVVRGLETGSLYIFTHPEQRDILRRRWERQDAVFAEGFEG